jgi:serine/threonine-protein kinase RsbW
MEIRLTLGLPRDQLSIPVVRRLCTQSLQVLGAKVGCQQDVEVAVTEACTNVLVHAGPTDAYEVIVGITERKVAIQIVDAGRGFDSAMLGAVQVNSEQVDSEQVDGEQVNSEQVDSEPVADADAEQGRGIQLMRALTDRLTFTARPERGTVVHMEKDLEWERDAPIRRLAGMDRPKDGADPAAAPPVPAVQV